MSNLIRIHNTLTDEVVDREMNSEELVELENFIQTVSERKAIELEKLNKRSELLERLGITEEEAQILLS